MLLLHKNQFRYKQSDMNDLVPSTPQSWICHKQHWLVTIVI